MNAERAAQLLREHRLQQREWEEARLRPLHEVLADFEPVTAEKIEAHRRWTLLHAGPGLAIDVDR